MFQRYVSSFEDNADLMDIMLLLDSKTFWSSSFSRKESISDLSAFGNLFGFMKELFEPLSIKNSVFKKLFDVLTFSDEDQPGT